MIDVHIDLDPLKIDVVGDAVVDGCVVDDSQIGSAQGTDRGLV